MAVPAKVESVIVPAREEQRDTPSCVNQPCVP
jgi:hypothetical protein